MRGFSLTKPLLIICGLMLAACGAGAPGDEPPAEMGTFRLGHNITVADNAQLGPLSRTAEPEEWEAALTGAIDERLGGYEGEGLFHLGIGLNAYALALPGVPLVVSPKSVLVITVNIWDNATQQKLVEDGRQFTIFEGLSPETLLGSGLTQSKEVQMQNLSRNAARSIQNWILEHPEWIGLAPDETAADAAATDVSPTQ